MGLRYREKFWIGERKLEYIGVMIPLYGLTDLIIDFYYEELLANKYLSTAAAIAGTSSEQAYGKSDKKLRCIAETREGRKVLSNFTYWGNTFHLAGEGYSRMCPDWYINPKGPDGYIVHDKIYSRYLYEPLSREELYKRNVGKGIPPGPSAFKSVFTGVSSIFAKSLGLGRMLPDYEVKKIIPLKEKTDLGLFADLVVDAVVGDDPGDDSGDDTGDDSGDEFEDAPLDAPPHVDQPPPQPAQPPPQPAQPPPQPQQIIQQAQQEAARLAQQRQEQLQQQEAARLAQQRQQQEAARLAQQEAARLAQQEAARLAQLRQEQEVAEIFKRYQEAARLAQQQPPAPQPQVVQPPAARSPPRSPEKAPSRPPELIQPPAPKIVKQVEPPLAPTVVTPVKLAQLEQLKETSAPSPSMPALVEETPKRPVSKGRGVAVAPDTAAKTVGLSSSAIASAIAAASPAQAAEVKSKLVAAVKEQVRTSIARIEQGNASVLDVIGSQIGVDVSSERSLEGKKIFLINKVMQKSAAAIGLDVDEFKKYYFGTSDPKITAIKEANVEKFVKQTQKAGAEEEVGDVILPVGDNVGEIFK